MNASYARAAQYRENKLASVVADRDPYRLVTLLLEGVLERIRLADASLDRGDIPRKASAISAAVVILNSLREALDFEAGGSIATRLDALYEYVVNRLIEANLRNTRLPLQEVNRLLEGISNAWAVLPAQGSGTHSR